MESKIKLLLAGMRQLRWKLVYKGVLVGALAGLLVSVYRIVIEYGSEKAVLLYQFLQSHPLYLVLWLAWAALASYLIYRLIKWEPYAKGSGIPQVEGIVLFGMKMKWYTILTARYLVGILSSFFGLSLGREGPSIQIGATGSQALTAKITKNKLEENYLITAGASAGLSAAFNAPLSGIMFALEEVHRSFSPLILIAATTAALTADFISKLFFGLTPVLSFVNVPQLALTDYPWLLVLGVLAGITGAIVNRGLLDIDELYKRLPDYLRVLLPLLLALPVGLYLPQVLGGGQGLIQMSESAQTAAVLMLIYLLSKFVFTCFSFGSGIPGGIFMPILAMGALLGNIYGQGISAFGFNLYYLPVLCVCAMAGVMSASIKAPVTSILLMAEMTGSLVHLLPVALVALIALLTADLLKIKPIYEVLLERLNQDKLPVHAAKKHDTLLEIAVELGSAVDGKRLKDITWPNEVLIVGLRRGVQEIIPNGDSIINHGDYLIVLSHVHPYGRIQTLMTELCQNK